jgi:hypothetical protein
MLSLRAVCLSVSALLPFTFAWAQEPEPLPDMVVTGKAEDLLGQTDSASKGRATQEDFLSRPLMRRGEILETIPGMIITQHAGGGKANQYFLRGFNLDHGTDFAVSIDGMPLNLRTHAHGQGYTDLNSVIPEMVRAIDYAKGPYTSANGDLSSAGSANFLLWDLMPENLVRFEFGEYNYYRALTAGTLPLAAETQSSVQQGLTYGLEFNYYDGPWTQPEEFNRWNGILRYFSGDEDNRFSVTFMGYRGSWTSTDQIPARAVQSGAMGRYDSLDPTAGGFSQRYSLNVAMERRDDDVVTRLNVYAIYYSLDLYSNFTYFMDFPPPVGDQFQQAEQRWIFGGNIARTWQHRDWWGADSDLTLGLQTRQDFVQGIGLWRTQQRQRHMTVRQDDVWQADLGLYAELVTRWNSWFRTVVGVRGDLFWFETRNSTIAANEGYDWAGIVSPELSAIFGPWHDTELYLNFGTGFHSNDARGVSTRIDPSTGLGVSTVDPLVRTIGAEIGVRTQAVRDVTTTLSFFWLQSDSELVYVGDAGTNEPGPASRRFGVELASYWRPSDWFSADGELALTYARFRNAPGMAHIPNSVPVMFSGGLNVGAQGNAPGWFLGMRVRVFANRPLEETNTVTGRDSVMLNGTLGYRRNNWEAAVDCLNILNRADNDIEYFYESQLAGEPAPVADRHFHPVEPRMFRFRVTYRF